MAKNPYHRVLALTATPGSTPEAIQSIVDSLHISRIEIRDENSIDLREYMHKKVRVKREFRVARLTQGHRHLVSRKLNSTLLK
jgi:ERCC4-related helicase